MPNFIMMRGSQKPTPAPWRVDYPSDRPHPVITAANGSRVAEVQYEADAQLIVLLRNEVSDV